ncbi:MAG TPA: molybdenum cofactor synthesis domain-containing protein, partial [Chloroflexota bacterium]|nr:molybdenum cofactor synthesis domain-containing protein [Chloroflexota bacterium]
LTAVEVEITPDEAAAALEIEATARVVGRTGVEMEALTAVSVAALTIYDMCKAVDRGMTIEAIRLVHKRGGRSGEYWREGEMTDERSGAPQHAHAEPGGRRISVAVVTISDSAARGEREEDLSGRAVRENVSRFGGVVEHYEIIPDEQEIIAETLKVLADDGRYDVILTTGGTGLGPRDRTPQATKAVIDYDVPGLAELMRAESAKRARFAYLSRAVVGVRGETLIANLPGSPKGCAETVEILAPYIPHAVQLLRGEIGQHSPR